MAKSLMQGAFSLAAHGSVRFSTITSYRFVDQMYNKSLSFSIQPHVHGMARRELNLSHRSCKIASTSSDINAIVLPSIYEAAKAGDDSAIDRLLSVAANSVNASCNEFGRTPLHYAALNGHHKVIDSTI